MQKVRTAVIGVGYLGRFHAQKYSAAEGCELVAVCDERAESRDAVAAELKTRAVADYRELLGEVDAVSIVTQTPAHYAIALAFLEAGTGIEHDLMNKRLPAWSTGKRNYVPGLVDEGVEKLLGSQIGKRLPF